MKMFLFKFHRNRTLTKKYFFEEEGKDSRERTPSSNFYHNLLSGKYMKMLCFKFQQNHTIIEQFEFFERRKRKGEERGNSFLNLNLDYYCYTYKTFMFKISARSQYK